MTGTRATSTIAHPLLRWLAFFVIGDILFALAAIVAVEMLVHGHLLAGSAWDAIADPAYQPSGIGVTWTLYEARAADVASTWNMVPIVLFMPGLVGAFGLARESLRQPGWRIWRWQ